jgi:23S rRNA (guanosine2251-2'-O)-methyltransferase
MLELRNPHSVLAALTTRPRDVARLQLVGGGRSPDDAWARVAEVAREKKVQISSGAESLRGPGGRGGKPADGGRTSFSCAHVREREGISIEELFAGAREKAGGRGLWLALDSLQDPHNVGAIFRTAAFFGVQGVVLTQERSAPLSNAVYDVASGGLEYVPFTQQINLQRAFEAAKEAGLWILGTTEHRGDDLAKIPRDRPWLIVLGNEEHGMRRLTEESCDLLCRIPAAGRVTSLNVSVAAGIAISSLSGT